MKPIRNLYLSFILATAAILIVVCYGFIIEPVREVANVHYIDAVGANFLFRGGLPLTEQPLVFNYGGLKRALLHAGERAGVKVPSSFYLLDVNLLNIEDQEDARRIVTEEKFFQANPRLGGIQVWEINGATLSVNDPALTANREYLARNLDSWLGDRLAGRVETLRRWLEGTPPVGAGLPIKPVVIYIHCVVGCDRTGEVSAAYYLRYRNQSWQEVNALNRSMCPRNRPFGCKNYRAVQWYALWLNLERGFSLNWRQEFPYFELPEY